MHVNEYRRELERLRLREVTVSEMGPARVGNPFMRTRLIAGTKPAAADLADQRVTRARAT
jgi:hypothetical protein